MSAFASVEQPHVRMDGDAEIDNVHTIDDQETEVRMDGDAEIDNVHTIDDQETEQLNEAQRSSRDILMTAIGTRGDVQPMVVMAQRLMQDGHRVRVACHAVHKESVESQGVEHYPVEGWHPHTLMENPTNTQDVWTRIQTFRIYDVWYRQAADSVYAAATEPHPETGNPFRADVLVSSPWSFSSMAIAEKLSIPFAIYLIFPVLQTKEFRHPAGLFSPTYGDTYTETMNKFSYSSFEQVVVNLIGPSIMRFREKLGLPTSGRFMQVDSVLRDLKVPVYALWSPSILPLPKDLHENVVLVGPIDRTGGITPSLDPEITKFLEAGSPPIYFGFGSMRYQPHLTAAWNAVMDVCDILGREGHRFLLQVSESDRHLVEHRVPKQALMLTGSVPHSTLFANVSMTVHHGGPGTYTASLTHGKPNVIISFVVDHPFWGEVFTYKNIGRHVPVEQVDTPRLLKAIRESFSEEVRANSVKMGKLVAAENRETGTVETFARAFYKHLPPKGEPVNWQAKLNPPERSKWIWNRIYNELVDGFFRFKIWQWIVEPLIPTKGLVSDEVVTY